MARSKSSRKSSRKSPRSQSMKVPPWLWYVAIGGAIYYYLKPKAPAGPALPNIATSPGGLQQIEAGLGSYVIH